MKDEFAHEVGTKWGNLVDGSRWPYDVEATHDNFRFTRLSLRRHLRTFVPDPDAVAAVGTEDGPAVVALAGDAVYVVKPALLREGEPPMIAMERFVLDPTKRVTVVGTLQDGHGTIWRDEDWRFEFANDYVLDITVRGTNVLGGVESDDAKLVRAMAAKVGYTVPDEQPGDEPIETLAA